MIRAYLGGSFNPIHQGHIQLAKEAIDFLNIDHIALVPCQDNHLKKMTRQIPTSERLALIEEAAKMHPFLTIDDRELTTGSTYSFTVNTLHSIAQQYPEDPLVFVMGSDSLYTLHLWQKWQQILDYCHLLVFHRSGYQVPELIPSELEQWLQTHLCHREDFLNHLSCTHKKNTVHLSPMQKPVACSSSQIRLNNKTN